MQNTRNRGDEKMLAKSKYLMVPLKVSYNVFNYTLPHTILKFKIKIFGAQMSIMGRESKLIENKF